MIWQMTVALLHSNGQLRTERDGDIQEGCQKPALREKTIDDKTKDNIVKEVTQKITGNQWMVHRWLRRHSSTHSMCCWDPADDAPYWSSPPTMIQSGHRQQHWQPIHPASTTAEIENATLGTFARTANQTATDNASLFCMQIKGNVKCAILHWSVGGVLVSLPKAVSP